jgi:hypothetical protein
VNPSESQYLDGRAAKRALLLTQAEALDGSATLSLETSQDMTEGDVRSYIEDNFEEFLVRVRVLSNEDQELLLCYFILTQPQARLAILHASTQSRTAARIKQAAERLAGSIMLGVPTAAAMEGPLVALELENLLAVPLSVVIETYGQTRSFQRVAEVLALNRPSIRRTMSIASKALAASADPGHKALGAYVFALIDKASAFGAGVKPEEECKQAGCLQFQDSAILGRFRMRVEDPGFCEAFSPSARMV